MQIKNETRMTLEFGALETERMELPSNDTGETVSRGGWQADKNVNGRGYM